MNAGNSLPSFWLNVTYDEIAAAIGPFVVERLSIDDPIWRKRVATSRVAERRRLWRRRLFGWLGYFRKTQQSVLSYYTALWANQGFPKLHGPNAAAVAPCEYRGEGLMVHYGGTKRVHVLLLMRALERLNPCNVLEVGFGDCLNLFVLAAQFPEISFAGIELTETGLARAREVQSFTELPIEIREFSPRPTRDPRGHQRIDFRQGNAKCLPFPDSSFDLVFTCLALEQMETIRVQALREIARVAQRYAVFVEPFADLNQTPLRRYYTRSHDYFSLSVADLREYGLEPLCVVDEIPHKITLAAGLVVAAKKRAR